MTNVTEKTKQVVTDLKERVNNEIEYRKNTPVGRSIQSAGNGIKSKTNYVKEAVSSVVNQGLNTRVGKVITTGVGVVASTVKTVAGTVVSTGKKIVSKVRDKVGLKSIGAGSSYEGVVSYQDLRERIDGVEPPCPSFPIDRDMTSEEIEQFGKYFRYHKDKGDMTQEELEALFERARPHIRGEVLRQIREEEERKKIEMTIPPEEPRIPKDREMTEDELAGLERYTRFHTQNREISPEEQEHLSRTTVDRLPELQRATQVREEKSKKRSTLGKVLHSVDKKLGKLENRLKKTSSTKKDDSK